MDEDSAPTITDSETTIEDNSVTVIVETPPEPEPEPEVSGPTLDTVLATLSSLQGDVAGVQAALAAITVRLDNAASEETTTDSEFSDTIESAPAAEPVEDTGPSSGHPWFRSIT